MDKDVLANSDDIRDVLEAEFSDGSDIEAEDVPSDVSLTDFSSGSGELYVPNYDELETSDTELEQFPDLELDEEPGDVRPVENSIPLPPPNTNPKWVRTYPPEPDVEDIAAKFRVRDCGGRNLPDKNSLPITYLYLFFTQAVFNFITRHTNYYANEQLTEKIRSGSLGPSSRLRRWTDITVIDVKKYIALLLNMGVIRLKKLSAYWDTRSSQHIPFFSRVMSANKFLLIHSYLHLTLAQTRRRGEQGYDPWVKVRFLLDHLKTAFKRYFVASQNVSIDESVIGMKNRCTFIQYMPNKKHARYGIKKFEVCDSKTAYILHFELYSGSDYLSNNPLPFTEKVIMDIMEKAGLLDKHYHLFTDNFYTKIPLAESLLNRNTYITGTINKKSKYLCKKLLQTKLEERESVYYRKGQILLVGFKQAVKRKPVYVISTACKAEDQWIRSKKGLEGMKPLVIHNYNQSMGGVDVSDQCIYHLSCARGTQKYWKKLFFNFLDMSVHNAFVLYKQNTDNPLSKKDFTVNIIEALANCDNDNLPQPLIPEPGPAGDANSVHKLTLLPNRRERLCEICGPTKKRGRSTYWCPGCNCGIHKHCYPYLEHFWRPVRKGRKRRASSSSSE